MIKSFNDMSEIATRPNQHKFREYNDEAFAAELARVYEATEIERRWMSEASNDHGAEPYETDHRILEDSVGRNPNTVQIRPSGDDDPYILRRKLQDWTVTNSHGPDRYSPPYLTKYAHSVLRLITQEHQREFGPNFRLSVTSAARSKEYQEWLAEQPGALTIPAIGGEWSSHTMGWAFDIDGSGLYVNQDDTWQRMNPRPESSDVEYDHSLVVDSRTVLRGILESLSERESTNFVEELAGSTRHCFHICPKPEYL